MKYRIVRENKPTLKNYGRYKAQAIHNQTIAYEQICQEIQANCSARVSDVRLVLTELSEVIIRHLQNGDRVRLKDLGLLKLEIESDKVDAPESFNSQKHIRGVRLHFLPESRQGHQKMYEGIRLEKAF